MREDAARFPEVHEDGSSRWVYQLDYRSDAVDIVKDTTPSELGYSELGDELPDYVTEHEFAVPYKIYNTEITGAWPATLNRIWDAKMECYDYIPLIEDDLFVANPHYIKPSSNGIWLKKAGHVFGYSLLGTALAFDGIRLFEAINVSLDTGNFDNSIKEVSSIASGWDMAIAGGELGAEVGAILCSPLLPPIGSTVCGFVGGLAGSLLGYEAGRKGASISIDAIKQLHMPSQAKTVSLNKPQNQLIGKNRYSLFGNFNNPVKNASGHNIKPYPTLRTFYP